MAVSLKTKRNNKITSVGDLFDNLFSLCNIQQDISLEKIRENWTALAGVVLSTHTTPVSLEEGKLRVLADHPVYASDFQISKSGIMKNINAQFGPVIDSISVFQKKNRFKK